MHFYGLYADGDGFPPLLTMSLVYRNALFSYVKRKISHTNVKCALTLGIEYSAPLFFCNDLQNAKML